MRGTWLELHFRWQIRTFWFGLLWVTLCALFIIATLGIGLLIAWLPLSLAAFREMAMSPAMHAIEHQRKAGLAGQLNIRTKPGVGF